VGRRRNVKGVEGGVVELWRCGMDKGWTSQSPKSGHAIFGLFLQNFDFHCSNVEAFIPKSRFGAFKHLQINPEQFLYTSTSRNHREVKIQV